MQTSVPYSNRYFSPDPVKREATHALLGAFTRRILSALAFGGLGVGVRSMYKDNMSGSDVLGAFGTGALLGTGLSTAADIIGAGTGLAAGGRQSREEAIENIDNNAWKYYLMPGYGGYQIGSGLRGMMKKHASVDKALEYIPWVGHPLVWGGMFGNILGARHKRELLGTLLGMGIGGSAGAAAKALYDWSEKDKPKFKFV